MQMKYYRKAASPAARRTVHKVLSALLALAACFTVFAFSPRTTIEAGNAATQKYEDQIKELEKTQKELLAKIKNIESEASETFENKQYLDSLITTVNSKIQAAEALCSELETQISDTEADIAEHEKLIEASTEKIKERMRANHEEGNASYLSVLLGAEGVDDFLSRLEKVNTILEYDKKTLAEYKTEKADLEAKKAELEDSKKLQEDTLATLKSDKAENERLASEAESYFSKLSNDKAAATAEYNKAKAAEEALDAQLQAMLAQIANQNSSQVTAAGEYMWPLPAGGYISCYFGDTDPGGRPHYAMDIAISAGTPIYASNDGSVVTATWHSSYGNYIVLDHGNGKSTLYAHCSGLAVSSGQSVSKGQVIGYVGSTGYSTGNHLHFEFRVNGQKVNPANYVSR